jgi:ATP-dependent Clp protease ATP-binding subunit ClpC
VIGQPDAASTAAGLVTTIKAGLADPGRPFGVLLFCGPTGVGKTEMVQTLARYCFGADGAKDRLVRLDMSEYSGWGAAQRLLQAPNGRPAAWIERVRQQPFCVVLFDEIEKASSEVFDSLLALMDEGRLSDRFGRVTQFRSAIIVMTSNLGANASAAAGFVPSAGPSYESEVSQFFRPEFFNRLDAVVTFRALSASDVEAIARKELTELAAREGFVAAGIRLECSEPLVAAVARAGYDHRFGARPLQRAIERMVATPLARWRVANPTKHNLTVKIGLDGQAAVVVTELGGSE